MAHHAALPVDDDYADKMREYEEKRRVLPEQLRTDHPLQHTWVLYWFKPDEREWLDCFSRVATVDTVEDFAVMMDKVIPPSKMRSNHEYWLFREGIEPQWEDPVNKLGGRWLIQFPRDTNARADGTLDNCWRILSQLVVGENFDKDSAMISGAVVQLRNRGDKIALWTQDAADDAGNKHIGVTIKGDLGLQMNILYESHADSQVKKGSKINARIEL